jgi:hypothetical protein
MPPKRKTSPNTIEQRATKASKKSDLLSLLSQEFRDVKFDPFIPEKGCQAKALLPPTFPSNPILHDYFTLLFPSNLYDIIVQNTNKYAAIQRLKQEERQREWVDLLPEELRVFLGAVIYMGVYDAPYTANYWNTDIKKGPLYTIPNYMSLNRWQQIKRYLHISCPYTDENTGLNKPDNKIW